MSHGTEQAACCGPCFPRAEEGKEALGEGFRVGEVGLLGMEQGQGPKVGKGKVGGSGPRGPRPDSC